MASPEKDYGAANYTSVDMASMGSTKQFFNARNSQKAHQSIRDSQETTVETSYNGIVLRATTAETTIGSK